jgi:hypothetical protein
MSGQWQVVLDASSFIKGWLIATTLWVAVILIVAPFVFGQGTSDSSMSILLCTAP